MVAAENLSGQDVTDFLERLKTGRVLCVGDLMLDRFCEGKVNRVSPEAPIPVIHVSREEAHLGGVGNVIRNLAALQVTSDLVSVCGDDGAADEIGYLLQDLQGANASLQRLRGRPSTIKTRFVANGQQLLRADWEKAESLDESVEDELFVAVCRALPSCGAVILSDYGKGVLSDQLIKRIIGEANNLDIPVIVDPKGNDFSCYEGASYLTPNRLELHKATDLPVETDAELIHACGFLMGSCGVGGVLATRSEQGMTLVSEDSQPTHFGARAMEVFDVAGAGDTVIAVFAAGLAAGLEPDQAAWLANVAAGIVVAKVGTAVALPDEILSSAHNDFWQDGEDKVVSLDTAVNRAQRWRNKGLKVGFTNGCFDLLHPGHISLIEQAAASCDRLILGLNSDSSVKRLKGETRPVQNEVSRATVLASLAKVAMVVIFSEETPLDLICEIKPDVLVKGADYTVETVVGAPEVQSWGGEVVLANLVEGQSTTRTIERLKD